MESDVGHTKVSGGASSFWMTHYLPSNLPDKCSCAKTSLMPNHSRGNASWEPNSWSAMLAHWSSQVRYTLRQNILPRQPSKVQSNNIFISPQQLVIQPFHEPVSGFATTLHAFQTRSPLAEPCGKLLYQLQARTLTTSQTVRDGKEPPKA